MLVLNITSPTLKGLEDVFFLLPTLPSKLFFRPSPSKSLYVFKQTHAMKCIRPETLPCGGRWRPPGCSLSRTDKYHLTSLSNPALISGDFSICRKKKSLQILWPLNSLISQFPNDQSLPCQASAPEVTPLTVITNNHIASETSIPCTAH